MHWQRALDASTETGVRARRTGLRGAARDARGARGAQACQSCRTTCRAVCADDDDVHHAESDNEWTAEDLDDLVSAAGGGRRLWDASAVHPVGVKNWRDTCNTAAALTYECPCGQRCLQQVGGIMNLYDFRRELRVAMQSKGSGGMRAVICERLAAHFDVSSCSFTNSFRVGDCGTVCERAFAVACGISEATFVRARADITKGRCWKKERQVKRKRESDERRLLDGWVRLQTESMEGDKIVGEKWYTEKTTEKQLWNRYLASCDLAKSPAVGNSRLLYTIWKEHTELKERKPTGHAICSTCGMISARRASLVGLVGAEFKDARASLDKMEAAHAAFHKAERKYYELAVARATHAPQDVTTITIDAPTMHQFDLPSQARSRRDTVKKLDGTCRWQSKLEGVLDAGDTFAATTCHTHAPME